MTRSIFDPTGGQTEHSGNVFTGTSADNDSHMPNEIIDADLLDGEKFNQNAATEQPGRQGEPESDDVTDADADETEVEQTRPL